MQIKQSLSVKLLTAGWICGVVAGMATLTNYSSAPGAAVVAPAHWPTMTELPHDATRPTLVMFVHPRCPCSNASINELARVAARCRDRMDLTVLFVKPPGSPSDWHQSALWTNAMSIPGVHAVADHDGRLASQFGVTTSGHCLVYGAQGTLLYSGGITAGRGHEGDSVGQTIVNSIAADQSLRSPRRMCNVWLPAIRQTSRDKFRFHHC